MILQRTGRRWARALSAIPLVAAFVAPAILFGVRAADPALEEKPEAPAILEAIPPGFYLHAYDDCGVEERQPHFDRRDSYLWTFQPSDTEADLKSRSAVFSYKSVNAVYEDLDPTLSYVLAVTYASDHVYKRVQSLWADGVELHGPRALPMARAVRWIVRVPGAVTRDGKMSLQWRIHGEVNATVSILELWANAPPRGEALRIQGVSGLFTDLTGQVLDLAYEPVAGAAVELRRPGNPQALAAAKSGGDGAFRFARSVFEDRRPPGDLEISASLDRRAAASRVSADQLSFTPVRYRPMPSRVTGLATHRQSLDGTWRLCPAQLPALRSTRLDAPLWNDFKVPGQWRQQGFDIPMERTVSVAREFTVPAEWSGHRIFLRFDAIHGGTRYWLNGQPLGSSENLFTPVEWEITAWARPGEPNRLDLEMKVDTVSEKLSFSSGYAFHNLGGIDRGVRIFALPEVHVAALRLSAGLDPACRDGELKATLTLDNPGKDPVSGIAIEASLEGPGGKPVELSTPRVLVDPLGPGSRTVELAARVADPLKWSAEKPHLYRLALELKAGGGGLERIERDVGFRRIEVRESRLLLNGVPIKLAGACRHETDPLTGRADTMGHAEEDIRLIKAANLNYIRTSHYPPTMELVEAADRLGVYLEVEAPFCWVGPEGDLARLREVLAPTSAMVDYYHSHPSVLVWSLANESHFNRSFEISDQMVKRLDPTRPTTFNNPDPRRICDIANLHYPPMPYDDQAREDPRPLFLGEYYFPVCHEQTEVMINPGLREFFGFGHSDPGSPFAARHAESFAKPVIKPCVPPGSWTHIVRSRRVLGGAIWASLDDAFYFPDGRREGYAWHHGFWGIIDAWRRPKPEWWLTKLVFSPVWFPRRSVEYRPGEPSIRLEVENRYAFTDLGELTFSWELGGRRGVVKAAVPPAASGLLEIPVPPGTGEGEDLTLWVKDQKGELVNALLVHLGRRPPVVLPGPSAGAPRYREEGRLLLIEGDGLSLVFDAAAGDFVPGDPRHKAAVAAFPSPHWTRYDFGDLAGPQAKPYAVFPDRNSRVVEETKFTPRPEGLEISVRERYDALSGSMSWLIDRDGVGKVRYDYVYSGPEMDTREEGVRFTLAPSCEEARWRRWSEWDIFPEDSICRVQGTARAFRPGTRGPDPEGVRPSWPWSQDQTELGTADFRSVKFNVYEAALASKDGTGLRVHARADLHVRPCLSGGAVLMHVLSRCTLGQVALKGGDSIRGECIVELLRPQRGAGSEGR